MSAPDTGPTEKIYTTTMVKAMVGHGIGFGIIAGLFGVGLGAFALTVLIHWTTTEGEESTAIWAIVPALGSLLVVWFGWWLFGRTAFYLWRAKKNNWGNSVTGEAIFYTKLLDHGTETERTIYVVVVEKIEFSVSAQTYSKLLSGDVITVRYHPMATADNPFKTFVVSIDRIHGS